LKNPIFFAPYNDIDDEVDDDIDDEVDDDIDDEVDDDIDKIDIDDDVNNVDNDVDDVVGGLTGVGDLGFLRAKAREARTLLSVRQYLYLILMDT
jgi:hypothetical protein